MQIKKNLRPKIKRKMKNMGLEGKREDKKEMIEIAIKIMKINGKIIKAIK